MAEKPLVWICTPQKHFEANGVLTRERFDALAAHYKDPILEFIEQPGLPWEVENVIIGGGTVFHARVVAASLFMERAKHPEDKLLFVDYDLMPTALDYATILGHDLPIVGGMYTTRHENGHWVLNILNGAAPSPTGVLQVMELGIGFKCFKRSVFQTVLDRNPWLNCESDADHRRRDLCFFSAGPVWDKLLWPGKGRFLTEDYWFDWLCRSEGIPTYVDTNVKIRHYDEDTKKIYPLSFPRGPEQLPLEAGEL